MNTRVDCFFLIATFLVNCAGSLPRVRDVTELAPPQKVQYEIQNRSVFLTWQASPHAANAHFAGYNIYIAKKSLILAPIKDLPRPIRLDKKETQYELKNLQRDAKYFIHLRSRNTKGEISLPSLPELVVPANK
ncbi:MAG: fibronectin type III domain-containing protein [bacterium]